MSGQLNPLRGRILAALDIGEDELNDRESAALDEALAQMEALVQAARGVRDTWKAYPREGWDIGDMLSLDAALAPFVGQPGDEAT